MKWNIVADSSCDVKKEDYTNSICNFEVVPLSINIGDKCYYDDENLDIDNFINEMENCKSASSSACPSPQTFYNAFLKGDQTICITMSAAASGTYGSAVIAKQMIEENFPQKKVFIINSLATAGIILLGIKKAFELIEKGKSFEEVSQETKKYTQSLNMLAVMQNYGNLIKNGRVTPTLGRIAQRLHIKTVVCRSDKGTIEPIKKLYGTSHVFEYIGEKIFEKGTFDIPIILSHCKNLSGVTKLKKYLQKKYNLKNISICECKGLTSYYTMRGGIIIAY